ncbi:MAG TPA: hypothetical protein VD965_11500 [Burkholderiales bacterium]|nr:hypothetical protein [Burkholderiales bacterium]
MMAVPLPPCPRRLLSGTRRTGLQVPPDVALGITQRYQRNASELEDGEPDSLLTIETIMVAAIYGVFAWCAFGAAIWVVAKVLIWAIGG